MPIEAIESVQTAFPDETTYGTVSIEVVDTGHSVESQRSNEIKVKLWVIGVMVLWIYFVTKLLTSDDPNAEEIPSSFKNHEGGGWFTLPF